MLRRGETIYQKANELVRQSGTRNTLQIADDLGIFVHYIDDFKELLGMYTYRHKERHILLNTNMEDMVMQMVCGHEIAHDTLYRDRAKGAIGLQEFVHFDVRNEME